MDAQPQTVIDLADFEAVPTRGEAVDKLDTLGVKLYEQCLSAIRLIHLSNIEDQYKHNRIAYLNYLLEYLDTGEISDRFRDKAHFYTALNGLFERLQEQDQWPEEGDRNILPNSMGLTRMLFEEYQEAEQVSLNGPFATGKKSRELGKRVAQRTGKILGGSLRLAHTGGRKLIKKLPSKETTKKWGKKIIKVVGIGALAGGIGTGLYYGGRAAYRAAANSAMVEKVQNSAGENDINLLIQELQGKTSWNDVWAICRETTASNIGKLVGNDGEEVFQTKSGTVTLSTSTDDDKQTIKIVSDSNTYEFYRDDEDKIGVLLSVNNRTGRSVKAEDVAKKLTEISKK